MGTGLFAFSARWQKGNAGMSLRIFRRLDARVPLLATSDSALRFENFRPADRPHRYPHRSARREVQGAPRRKRH